MGQLDPYERQAGRAGLEETFAESGARFVVIPQQLSTSWTNLFDFWQGAPFGAPEIAAEPMPELAEAADSPIGTARIAEAGAIELELRAEGAGGAIGHAVIRLARGDAAYGKVREHVFGSGEAIAAEPTPFRPMAPTAGP